MAATIGSLLSRETKVALNWIENDAHAYIVTLGKHESKLEDLCKLEP